MCYCGRTLNEHHESVRETFKNEEPLENEKWEVDKEDHQIYVSEDGLTDAFGEVRFVDNGDTIAKVLTSSYN